MKRTMATAMAGSLYFVLATSAQAEIAGICTAVTWPKSLPPTVNRDELLSKSSVFASAPIEGPFNPYAYQRHFSEVVAKRVGATQRVAAQCTYNTRLWWNEATINNGIKSIVEGITATRWKGTPMLVETTWPTDAKTPAQVFQCVMSVRGVSYQSYRSASPIDTDAFRGEVKKLTGEWPTNGYCLAEYSEIALDGLVDARTRFGGTSIQHVDWIPVGAKPLPTSSPRLVVESGPPAKPSGGDAALARQRADAEARKKEAEKRTADLDAKAKANYDATRAKLKAGTAPACGGKGQRACKVSKQ